MAAPARHHVRVASHIARYRRGRDEAATRSSTGGSPAIPTASQLQASLMLVPKSKSSAGEALQRLSSDGTLEGFQGLLVKCRLAW